ncbi:scarecrow-like protein 32 [Cucurbita pepo subsp. pepo]|uniref:scarecrow-like protein 32 n=1 Tax=Cucurbita pepo subsp. pepo TaxID=3664 RepID=UPI000C9D567C|nr:scarecrow-like protein 32 [Cucurbita pepo subsp. pepo]
MNNQSPITVPRRRPWPGLFASSSSSSSSSKALGTWLGEDANCMEHLLVHCANAIESNDATLAQQILWVLNNIATPDGDSNQRLASAFLRALVTRAANIGSCKILAAITTAATSSSLTTQSFSLMDLAAFVDLTPWHRFGFTTANAAILDAIEGYSAVHVVDFSLMHCMQIPTLIDAIATRFEFPPLLKLTTVVVKHTPPILELSYEELGAKLVNFARSKNVRMEYRFVESCYTDGFSNLIQEIRVQNLIYGPESKEALILNCHMMLHYIPEETLNPNPSPNFDMLSSTRSMFLKEIRSLEPAIVILVDEEADFTASKMVSRLRSAFNYLWIPYDSMDSILPRNSKHREWYEAGICRKIQNVIAEEGIERVERLEPKTRWVQRMVNSKFRGVGFGEDAVSEVKTMLDEHAAGWGLKKEDNHLLLTWKGHDVVFATAWVPY